VTLVKIRRGFRSRVLFGKGSLVVANDGVNPHLERRSYFGRNRAEKISVFVGFIASFPRLRLLPGGG
jgi:hypothetical protein